MKKVIAIFLCIVMCFSTVSVTIAADSTTVRDVTVEESYASELKSLGLFKGVSETDFDLKRAPTRVEALVMLIRVLGEEKAALGGSWKHPFKDVAKWADPYVGYAYETGLTKGISATEFGTGDATAAMYLTFILRALGYTDVNNEDFSWSDPYSLAKTVGILTDAVNIEVFWRADAVTVSYDALSSYLKNSEQTLADKLIKAGVFTKEQYDLTGVISSVQCGDNVVAILYRNGELVIEGTGDMWDNMGGPPFLLVEQDLTKTITVKDGVTSIGAMAFANFTLLTSVTIPDSVTRIGYRSFNGCTALANITIPNSVTSTGDYAFAACTALTSLDIPDSVTDIDMHAFNGCDSLKSISFGKNVEIIMTDLFMGCDSLERITVSSDNAKYCSDEDGVLFNKDKTQIIKYPAGNTRKTYTVPDHVQSIRMGAFSGCSALECVIILNRRCSIGLTAFHGTASNFEIHGYSDSKAEEYANENGHIFVPIG